VAVLSASRQYPADLKVFDRGLSEGLAADEIVINTHRQFTNKNRQESKPQLHNAKRELHFCKSDPDRLVDEAHSRHQIRKSGIIPKRIEQRLDFEPDEPAASFLKSPF